MLFFTTAIKKHTLQFKRLSEYTIAEKEQGLMLAATWATKAWGYIHEDEDFHYKELASNQEHIFIAFFSNQPVAMFGLFFKPLDSFPATQKRPHAPIAAYLDYVYVDEKFRGLGFARQLVDQAKELAKSSQAQFIYLETLNPNVNRVYLHQGAKQICESQYCGHTTNILSFKLGLKDKAESSENKPSQLRMTNSA